MAAAAAPGGALLELGPFMETSPSSSTWPAGAAAALAVLRRMSISAFAFSISVSFFWRSLA